MKSGLGLGRAFSKERRFSSIHNLEKLKYLRTDNTNNVVGATAGIDQL